MYEMAGKDQEFPYKKLGGRLKGMREHLSESLAEVSGAVEIEIDTLHAIETGSDRPSEDILLLLISHFAVKEDEATTLWEMAGYDKSDSDSAAMANTDLLANNTVLMMPVDTRIMYTDMANVVVNNHGVVLNFLQTSGPNNQPLAVSRLGMSREHALSLLELLQKTLANSGQNTQQILPAPKQTKDDTAKTDKQN